MSSSKSSLAAPEHVLQRGGPSLSTLLGSQVEAFHTQLHAASAPPAAAPAGARGKAAIKKSAAGGLASRHAASSASSPALLPTPFTHTIRQVSLLSSLLSPTPAAGAGLVTTLDVAHSILAQLLPKEVEGTPPPAEFHALFMQYLDACAGSVASANPAAAASAAEEEKKAAKKRKRDQKESDAAGTSSAGSDSSRTAHHALHTVSTTVIGRLAARCISLLTRDTESVFDASLIHSSSSYWSVLWLLLRSDSLSARFTPSLFPLLCKQAALPVIECALIHLHDASERDLVQVAKYALDNLPPPALNETSPELALDLLGGVGTPQQQTKKKRRKSARAMVTTANALSEPVKVVDVPGGPFAVILDLLLTSPVSGNFLRHSLAALAPSAAHKLLLYLYAWTLRYWFHTESEVHQVLHQIAKDDLKAGRSTQFGSKFRIPNFSQVIDWMNILLDAIDFMHVYQKEAAKEAAAHGDASSNSSAPTLSLYDLVASLASHISHHHLTFLDRSQDLKGFISIFAQMKRQPNSMPLPQAPMMDYNVECLELSC